MKRQTEQAKLCVGRCSDEILLDELAVDERHGALSLPCLLPRTPLSDSKGEQCTCTNYRMEHPHRVFKDELGVLVRTILKGTVPISRFCQPQPSGTVGS